uniref:Adenylate kinase n=1 Tax=Ditylenchus dipsaci TaxID=166011 RepID=A0A915E6B2_9BILA
MATSKTRKEPNVLITGTPGTGKSTLAARLAQNLGFEFIDIGKEVKERSLFSEYDEQYKSHVLDEDKLLDFLEDRMNSDDGGVVLDYHSSEFFPQRWFDFVFVLRCENTEILYDRLASRNYSASKTSRMCRMWARITYGARWAPEITKVAASRALNLSKVKSIKVSMDPFYAGNKSLREFWYHVCDPEVKETNPSAKISTEIRNDGKEPFFEANLDDNRKIVFKTEGMLAADVLIRFNRLLGNKELGKLRVKEEEQPPEDWRPVI